MTSLVETLDDASESAPVTISYPRDEKASKVGLALEVADQDWSAQKQIAWLTDVRPHKSEFQSWWLSFLEGNVFEPQRSTPVSVVDLFSASGGLSLGVDTAAGWLDMSTRTVFAADIDDRALEVFSQNHFPETQYCGSVEALVSYATRGKGDALTFTRQPTLTPLAADLVPPSIDLVVGGPPCQGNSSANSTKTRHSDPRNRLFLTSAAFAIACNARAVLIENVPGVRKDHGNVVEASRAVLRAAGYKVSETVISAAHLGWPQTRKRFFMAAVRERPHIDLSAYANAFVRDTEPVSWLLEDLLGKAGGSFMDTPSKLSPENQARIKYLTETSEKNLPDNLRPDCHKDGHTYPSVYGRMAWDQPSGTITTGFQTPGRGRFIHPLEPRVLTPREAARIQGFPDDYFDVDFGVTRSEIAKWIGDAVPPYLGAVAAVGVLKALRG